MLAAKFSDENLVVDKDPTGLKQGVLVQLYPLDGGGFSESTRDTGRLIKLTKDEVAIAVRSETDDIEVHVHAPRWGFKAQQVDGAQL